MLSLEFEGYFQCRLATDPDPSDERRGVSGWTFAVAPEPGLDRVIRFQDPVAQRAPGPTVGVTVRRVSTHEQPLPAHPLLGARVNLLDNPKFEGRSGIIAEDALEPIDPFLLEIFGGGVTLRREDFWDRRNPRRVRIIDVPPPLLARRQPADDVAVSVAEVFEAAGIPSPATFFGERRQHLVSELANTADADRRAGLQTRLDHIEESLEGGGTRLGILGASLVYRFEINGPGAVVDDPGNALGGTVYTAPAWPIQFWMGGFDADSLCGYTRGSLSLPFRAEEA